MSNEVLKWYWVYQNNSGGYHHTTKELAANLFVQAASQEAAIKKLKELTAESNEDSCDCCGIRWQVTSPTDVGTNPFDGYHWNPESRYHWDNGDVTKTHPRSRARMFGEDGRLIDNE